MRYRAYGNQVKSSSAGAEVWYKETCSQCAALLMFVAVLATPVRKVDSSRKLLLLSADSAEEYALREHLSDSEEMNYILRRVESIEEIRHSDLSQLCDAVLLDMRISREAALEAIRFLADTKCSVALLCLCRNHRQLREFREVFHLVDDYILAETLTKGELPTRISHAVRRCRREYELMGEQNLFRALLNNIPDAIYFKDVESRFIKVNAAMTASYGSDSMVFEGKTDFDLFTPEHARPAYEDEQTIMRTDTPIVGKLERETLTDGRINWVSTTKVPLKDQNGRIIGTMGISRNITDLKEAEDKLARESQLLKTVIHYALAGIFVKDREGRYLIVNERHATYLGAESADAVRGKTIHDFNKTSHADIITAGDAETMESGKGIENLIDHRERDGRDFWLLTSKVPFYNEEGACIGLVGISQDITVQKETEYKLKSTIQTLEETKLQLIEAEKLKTVGRLAAGVAHEVKNPLSVVMLGVNYLKEHLADNEELARMLSDMDEAVNKANDVVFELLDYSAPHEVTMVPTQINRLIKHVLTLMRHNLNEAHITLIDETRELPEVLVDTSKMDQVFINLILNAISAMPDGGELILRTRVERMKKAGHNVSGRLNELFRIGDELVIIEIIDSGHGLTAEVAKKAFDPFYSSNPTGEGTGLGLSVTRSIIEMHHGLLTLENRDDSTGACARIYFSSAKNYE